MFFNHKIIVISLVILITKIDNNYGSRILAIFPIPYRDNQLTFVPLIKNLIENGHHLTVLTTNPNIFLNQIKYENSLDLIDLSFTNHLEILNELNNYNNVLSGSDMLRQVFRVMRTIAEIQLNSIEITEFLHNNSNSQYDGVLVDWSGSCLMNGFAYKYKIPLIGITPGGAYMISHEAIGNPNHPVLFPSILMPFSENLNLFQRIASAIFSYNYRNIYFNEELPMRDEIAKKIFGADIPSLWEIQSNADLLLINSFQALGNARPIGPTTIHLGGIHSKVINLLPNDLEEFLDMAENKVIYINLGEIVNRIIVGNEYHLKKLVNILEMSRFDIVWNMNGMILNNFTNSTARIYQSDFIDQEDVLAHPNVKLFITIGGQHDIEDAIKHKVPCLGFTFSTNIEHYLVQIVKNQAGLLVDINLESTAEILGKIESFAISDKYEQNMKNLHQLIYDQPMTSIDRARWWIEYVLRNNGTKNLKNSWNKITWFEYLLCDIILTVLILTIIMVGVLAKIIIEIRKYSKSLPFEKITRRSLLMKQKML